MHRLGLDTCIRNLLYTFSVIIPEYLLVVYAFIQLYCPPWLVRICIEF